jgi:excisionase family DNA binding protein
MSSKIEIIKICEFCGEEFVAKTTVTRFCSHKCNSRSYKRRVKEQNIGKAIEKTNQQKIISATDVEIEVIKQKEFLSIKEIVKLLNISERTVYRLLKKGTIPSTKLGGRTIIKRSDIDKLFTA